MLIQGGEVFSRDNTFVTRDVSVENGEFTFSPTPGDPEIIDASGCYVIPGLVDVHTHGALGCDFSDAARDELSKMARYYLKSGVTSVLATSMTLPESELASAYKTLRDFDDPDGARIVGINMEGPFFCTQKKGAQPEKYLLKPNYDLFMRLNELSGGKIKLVCVAPELDGAVEFIKRASKVCAVSLAHTAATYDEAMAGFDAGANHVTHLFNGMNSFLHREPGVVGAAADFGAYSEVISDGYHLHPSIVRNAFKLIGADKVCMISDSLSCAGLADGEYSLAGQRVFVNNGKATLESGTLAGSSINLLIALRRTVSFGVALEAAVAACSAVPAASIGMADTIGAIDEGCLGDCLVLKKDLGLLHVIKGGKVVNTR